MRCDYEVNGKVSLSNGENTKKTVLKDLVLQSSIHNKLTKTHKKT